MWSKKRAVASSRYTPDVSVVLLSRNLKKILTKEELEALVAHEMTHNAEKHLNSALKLGFANLIDEKQYLKVEELLENGDKVTANQWFSEFLADAGGRVVNCADRIESILGKIDKHNNAVIEEALGKDLYRIYQTLPEAQRQSIEHQAVGQKGVSYIHPPTHLRATNQSLGPACPAK